MGDVFTFSTAENCPGALKTREAGSEYIGCSIRAQGEQAKADKIIYIWHLHDLIWRAVWKEHEIGWVWKQLHLLVRATTAGFRAAIINHHIFVPIATTLSPIHCCPGSVNI